MDLARGVGPGDTPALGSPLVITLLELPLVLPPAVAGVGLLAAYGRFGLVGAHLDAFGILIPFSELAVTVAIVLIPELGVVSVGGVPLSWLLHAFAFYPVIVLFAVLYTRAAARNERRYLALRERE